MPRSSLRVLIVLMLVEVTLCSSLDGDLLHSVCSEVCKDWEDWRKQCTATSCSHLIVKGLDEFFECFRVCWAQSRVCVGQCALNFWNIYSWCSQSHQCPAHGQDHRHDINKSGNDIIESENDVKDSENGVENSDVVNIENANIGTGGEVVKKTEQQFNTPTTGNVVKPGIDIVIKTGKGDETLENTNSDIVIKPSLGINIKTSKRPKMSAMRKKNRNFIKKGKGNGAKTETPGSRTSGMSNVADRKAKNALGSESTGNLWLGNKAEGIKDQDRGDTNLKSCRRACAVKRFSNLRKTVVPPFLPGTDYKVGV